MLDKHSIFYALYFGDVSPWEESKLPGTQKYRKLTEKAAKMQDEISAQLNDSGKQLFEDFLRLDGEIRGYFTEEKFKDGFILGSRLMIETLTDDSFNKRGV